MASSVFYRWASRKDESRISFDGTGITVFDLKREIILANSMGKANDFELYIYDATSKQEYKEDTQTIPRSSAVVVKRLPAPRGKGRIPQYLSGVAGQTGAAGTGPGSNTWQRSLMSKRFDMKEEPSTPTRPSTMAPSQIVKEDEAAALAAMFKVQSENWEEAQERMSHAQRVDKAPRSGAMGFTRGGKPAHVDRPLPPSYVCYRCGQKGHWIQDCPTNSDREFDHRPRIKRTTGIPRSMLKAVENPSSGELGGVMVTPEGGYVVAQPDLASWQKQVLRVKGLTASEVREKPPSDKSLACPIDNKLFRDAVKTPCCNKNYCEECIQTHLLERDFVCPNCAKKIPSLDKLIVDKPARTRVADYIEKAIEESRKEGAEEDGNAMKTEESNFGEGDQQNSESGEGQAEGNANSMTPTDNNNDFFGDTSLFNRDFQMHQQILDKIPQLQASMAQVSLMLQKSDLPPNIRRQTELYHQQLQNELQQAQAMTMAFATATAAAAAAVQQVQQQQQEQEQQMAAVAAVVAAGGMGPGAMGVGHGMGGLGGGWNGNPFNGNGMDVPGLGGVGLDQGAGGMSAIAAAAAGGTNPDSAYQRLPVNNRRRNLKRDRPSDFSEVTEEKMQRTYWE